MPIRISMQIHFHPDRNPTPSFKHFGKLNLLKLLLSAMPVYIIFFRSQSEESKYSLLTVHWMKWIPYGSGSGSGSAGPGMRIRIRQNYANILMLIKIHKTNFDMKSWILNRWRYSYVAARDNSKSSDIGPDSRLKNGFGRGRINPYSSNRVQIQLKFRDTK